MSARKKTSLSVLVLWSTASAILCVMLLLLLCAMLICGQVLAEDAGVMFSAVAAGIGPMLSIIVFGRQSKTPAVLGGVVLAVYLFLCLLIGLILCGGEIFGAALGYRAIAAVIGTAVGIMVSLHKKPKRKVRKTRR